MALGALRPSRLQLPEDDKHTYTRDNWTAGWRPLAAVLMGRGTFRGKKKYPRPHHHPARAKTTSSRKNAPTDIGAQQCLGEEMGYSERAGGRWPTGKEGRGLSSSPRHPPDGDYFGRPPPIQIAPRKVKKRNSLETAGPTEHAKAFWLREQ